MTHSPLPLKISKYYNVKGQTSKMQNCIINMTKYTCLLYEEIHIYHVGYNYSAV